MKKRKKIIGLFVGVSCFCIGFYLTSNTNEEVNNWEQLVETDNYVKNLKEAFEPALKNNEEFEKTLNKIEENNYERKDILNKTQEIKEKYVSIEKDLEELGNYENEKNKDLDKEINKLKKSLIEYLDIQQERAELYGKFVSEEGEIITENIARIEIEIEGKVKEHEEIKEKIEESLKK